MEYNIRFILNMERKSFISSFNKIMMKNYFKKRGNNWINIKDDITKIIMLQKSKFGNNYYINYGYNINNLNELFPIWVRTTLRLLKYFVA